MWDDKLFRHHNMIRRYSLAWYVAAAAASQKMIGLTESLLVKETNLSRIVVI